MKEFHVSKSHQDNITIAKEILTDTTGVTRTRATVFGLSGELGSGKTTWTKGLVEALGGNPDKVQSPTFVLMRDYGLGDNLFGFTTIHHLDLYRIKSADEFKALRLDDELQNPHKLFVVEWWQTAKSVFSDGVVELSFETINDYTKTISVAIV